MKLSEEWADKAVEAVRLFELFRNGEIDKADMVFSNSIGVFEHVVHELSHAATLGVEPSEHMAHDIAAILTPMASVMSITNEAMTFACEAHVLRHFGLLHDDDDSERDPESDAIAMEDIYSAADVQGCTADEVDRWFHDDGIGFAVDRVVTWMEHPRFPAGLLEDDYHG
jgi:hypothetical protein